MWHIPFNTGEHIDFGGVVTISVEVWSWKLCQFKDPLAFGAAIRGSVNQNTALRRIVEISRSTARCFDDSTQYDVLIHGTADRSGKDQWILIWHNFQDQTSTAKVAIFPNNIRKMPQILLNMLFWKINLIKMMKIFIFS